MPAIQDAALLGSFLVENEDRIAKRAAKALKHELDESLSREQRKAAAPSFVGELGRLLLERGDAAPRLWGEAVRHYGGLVFERRADIADLVREFKVLELAIQQEWSKRAGALPEPIATLIDDCLGEGLAAASSDFVRKLRGQRVQFRESALIETILEHLDEGILLVEADGTFSFATRPAVSLFGTGLQRALGRPLNDPAFDGLLGALDARSLDGTPVVAAQLPAGALLRGGQNPDPLIVRVRPGGRERILELRALPIYQEGEGPQPLRGVILTARDRTVEVRRTEELRAANRELAELHTRLLHRSRSQAMGELAAGAAHALNNLLNAMHLRLKLARENPDPQRIDELERSVNDIAQLVARLQQFATQRPSGPVGPVELSAVARESLALVRPEARRSGEDPIKVRVEIVDSPPVRGNAPELRELLVSLLLYARDQLTHGGSLELTCHGAEPGGELVLSFRGAGQGPAQDRDWLDPFLDAQAPASLALAASSARDALQRWGGGLKSVIVEGGAELTLSFAPEQPAVEPPRPAAPAPAPECQRILVVDDDPDNAAMLAEVLAAEGHETVTALTGREALEKWAQQRFEVALVDLLMPDMSGTDIARALRQARPEAKVALVTGWDLDETQRQAAPVHAVFRKPVDLERLLSFIGGEEVRGEEAQPPAPAP